VIKERKDGLSRFRIMNRITHSESYFQFGEDAYMAEFSVNEEYDSETFRYFYSSLTTPNSHLDFDLKTGEKTLVKQYMPQGDYTPEDYQSERIMVTARD
jgi:oligopeptidase B